MSPCRPAQALAARGTLVVAGCADGLVYLLHAHTGQELAVLGCAESPVSFLAQDGPRLVVVGAAGNARAYALDRIEHGVQLKLKRVREEVLRAKEERLLKLMALEAEAQAKTGGKVGKTGGMAKAGSGKKNR
jgi:hypothetical protein